MNYSKINNYLGYTFYANDISQLDESASSMIGRIEALLMNNNDLKNNWENAWSNIQKVVNKYGSENISFHFPFDDADYINDLFVQERLIESIERSDELGLRCVVIHANQRYLIGEWKKKNLNVLREIFLEKLYKIVDTAKGNTIVCLENMPPIGNLYDDADPLFIFPKDFENLDHEQIKIVFDINHYFNSVTTMKAVRKDKRLLDYLPNVFLDAEYLDFKDIIDNIFHWHFSAFDHITDPIKKISCNEGVLPDCSESVDTSLYREASKIIIDANDKKCNSVIFEVKDIDYSKRTNVKRMAEWFNKNEEQ